MNGLNLRINIRGGIVDIEFIVQYLQLRPHLTIHPYCVLLQRCSREPRRTQFIGRQRCRTASTRPLDLQSIQGHLRLTLEGQLDGAA